MNEIILSTQNGEPVASSREVAKRFGKEHKHVLAAIRQILAAENSATKFFHETAFEYRGQRFPEYLMNRDGFSLLAMGFTGKEAVQWKLKYIQAFNEMEKQLAQRPQLSRAELMAQALIAAHDELEHKDAQIAELTPKGIFADTSSGTEDEYMSQHYKIDCDKVEDRKALVVVLSMNGYTVRVGKEKRSGKSTLTYFVEYWRGDDE